MKKCVRMHGDGSPKIRTDISSRLHGYIFAVGLEGDRMLFWKAAKGSGNRVKQWSVR